MSWGAQQNTEAELPSRRRAARADIAGEAKLSWMEPDKRFYTQPALAIDRSEEGYAFRLDRPPALGQRIQVDLPPARRYWGTVRNSTWVDGIYRVGVEIDPQPLSYDE